MQEEILSLKLRISEQDEVIKGTVQRLRNTSRTKESMEHFIVSQCECRLHVCVCVWEKVTSHRIITRADRKVRKFHVVS